MSAQNSILVIDDDEVVHILTSSIIESLNFRCISARTIEEGAKALSSEMPRLILCDMNLPDGDGLSFLMESKKLHANCPFILMSAEPVVDAKLKQIPILPDSFLPKPFTANQLIEAIQGSI